MRTAMQQGHGIVQQRISTAITLTLACCTKARMRMTHVLYLRQIALWSWRRHILHDRIAEPTQANNNAVQAHYISQPVSCVMHPAGPTCTAMLLKGLCRSTSAVGGGPDAGALCASRSDVWLGMGGRSHFRATRRHFSSQLESLTRIAASCILQIAHSINTNFQLPV